MEGANQKAGRLLQENIEKLHAISQALLERECLDGEEVEMIIKGEQLPPKNGKEDEKKTDQPTSAA